MLQVRLEREFVYKQIHKWLTDEEFKKKKKLSDIIREGHKWGCTLEEYIRIYPQDERFL